MVHSVGNRLQPRPEVEKLAFSDDALTKVRSGMNRVMNEGGGTAFAWRIPDPGFEMAGKTGTAQVRVYSQEEHAGRMKSNASLQWKLRDHALFIGFAPVQAPKYAMVCMIEHGATTAHPHVQMARDILLFAQKRNTLGKPTAYPVTAAAAVPAANKRAANTPADKEPG